MTSSIYKYSLAVEDEQILLLPKGAILLSVHNQFEKIVLYAVVDVEQEVKVSRYFLIVGTGHSLPEDLSLHYIGTVPLYEGELMFHVFEDVTV